MKAICGADCSKCEYYNKKCKGCNNTDACPFGKKCWIAKYIEVGGQESFEEFKGILIDEINKLNVEGMPKIDNLYPLHGEFINLEYQMPSGDKVKLLDDNESYLGNQVESVFNDNTFDKCFGIAANTNFILICEYDVDGNNPEIIVYKKR